MSLKLKKYRVVECINIVWECEAKSEEQAKEMYYMHCYDAVEFQRLIDEGSSETEVFQIDEEGNCV